MAKKKFTVDIDLDGNDILNCPRLDTIESDISQEVTDRQAQGMYLENYIDQVSNDLSVHSTDTNNPHQTTLEQARSQNSSLSGDINANTNTIINIRDAVNPQEPITKSQWDSFNASVGRQRGEIDCSSNPNYPASKVGDRWEVSVAGKIGGASGIAVQVYDEIVCKTDSASGDQATVGMNFYVIQGNVERASESVSGYTQHATDAEVQTGTENTKTFTPLKLTNWWSYIKGIANTWALKQTFTTAPRLSSTTANQRLEVDSNKDIVSVAKGSADNKDFGTTAGTVTEGNDSRLSDTRYNKCPFKQNATISHTGTASNTKVYSALIPGGTFSANDILRWMLQIGATSNANTKTFRYYFNTTDSLTGATLAGTYALSSGAVFVGSDRVMTFKGSISSQEVGIVSSSFQSQFSASASSPSALTIDFSVDQYFIVAIQLANGADTANIFSISSELYR